MKAKYLTVLLLLLLSFRASRSFSQDFIVRGVVIEKASNVRIALAEIVNIRTKTGTTSNELGMFQLNAQAGDTLKISKKNLISQKVAVKPAGDLIIYLLRGTTMLEEVTIKANSRKQEMDEIRQDFKNNGSFFAGKPPLILLNPFGGSPLTFIYELFEKTPARARNFNKYYKRELKLSEVDQYFNKTLITGNTNLRGKELDKFMLDYYPSYDLASTWNRYDAIKYIKESAKNYTDTLKHTN